MEHLKALSLIYSRIVDLEHRQRMCEGLDIEGDKLKALYRLVDDVLRTRRGLTEEEIAYHKLAKYLPGGEE